MAQTSRDLRHHHKHCDRSSSEINEALCKELCQDLCVEIQSVHELGTELRFGGITRMHNEPNKHQILRLGDTVRILSGPFVSFTGKIEGINQAKALLRVKVAIYGRNKPVKLRFADVEVVSAS